MVCCCYNSFRAAWIIETLIVFPTFIDWIKLHIKHDRVNSHLDYFSDVEFSDDNLWNIDIYYSLEFLLNDSSLTQTPNPDTRNAIDINRNTLITNFNIDRNQLLQYKLLNGIFLGQTKSDNINRTMAISYDLHLVIFNKWDVEMWSH